MTSVPYHGTAQQTAKAGASATDAVGSWALPLYMVTTLLPLSITLLSLRLTPLRVLLLALFIPFLIRIVRGEAGRFTVIDVLMMLHAAWITLALVVVHGTSKIPFAGITMVELVGGYLMGRVLIRNAEDYLRFVRLMVAAMLFLLPFAVLELLTGRILIAEIIGIAFETISRADSATARMGLERVYTVFEHPILYGLFCSIAFANLYYLVGRTFLFRWGGLSLTTFMTFASLSSAPLLACGLQGGMILWDRITRGAWTIFVVLGVVGYVTVDALSNRTPITILIETLTFNAGTGWTRIAIFEWGIQNAIDHPLFGIGFNDWERPQWLTDSVDNFWLLTTMRFGFICAGFLVAAFVVHIIATLRATIEDPKVKLLRTGYLIALLATCFSMVTVHIWGAVGVFVMFYLGAGSWFYTASHDTEDDRREVDTEDAPTGPVFSRFSAASVHRVTTSGPARPAPQPHRQDAATPAPYARTFE